MTPGLYGPTGAGPLAGTTTLRLRTEDDERHQERQRFHAFVFLLARVQDFTQPPPHDQLLSVLHRHGNDLQPIGSPLGRLASRLHALVRCRHEARVAGCQHLDARLAGAQLAVAVGNREPEGLLDPRTRSASGSCCRPREW